MKKIIEEFLLHDSSPSQFVQFMENHELEDESGYLIMNHKKAKQMLYENVKYLESDETVSFEWFQSKMLNDFQVIAYSIDGDYLACDTQFTYVIPQSLYRQDIETFSLSIGEFLLAYFNQDIDSTILD